MPVFGICGARAVGVVSADSELAATGPERIAGKLGSLIEPEELPHSEDVSTGLSLGLEETSLATRAIRFA